LCSYGTFKSFRYSERRAESSKGPGFKDSREATASHRAAIDEKRANANGAAATAGTGNGHDVYERPRHSSPKGIRNATSPGRPGSGKSGQGRDSPRSVGGRLNGGSLESCPKGHARTRQSPSRAQKGRENLAQERRAIELKAGVAADGRVGTAGLDESISPRPQGVETRARRARRKRL
jgi:hypothetical protein